MLCGHPVCAPAAGSGERVVIPRGVTRSLSGSAPSLGGRGRNTLTVTSSGSGLKRSWLRWKPNDSRTDCHSAVTGQWRWAGGKAGGSGGCGARALGALVSPQGLGARGDTRRAAGSQLGTARVCEEPVGGAGLHRGQPRGQGSLSVGLCKSALREVTKVPLLQGDPLCKLRGPRRPHASFAGSWCPVAPHTSPPT